MFGFSHRESLDPNIRTDDDPVMDQSPKQHTANEPVDLAEDGPVDTGVLHEEEDED